MAVEFQPFLDHIFFLEIPAGFTFSFYQFWRALPLPFRRRFSIRTDWPLISDRWKFLPRFDFKRMGNTTALFRLDGISMELLGSSYL